MECHIVLSTEYHQYLLDTGIESYEGHIEDLYSTLGQRRDGFRGSHKLTLAWVFVNARHQPPPPGGATACQAPGYDIRGSHIRQL